MPHGCDSGFSTDQASFLCAELCYMRDGSKFMPFQHQVSAKRAAVESIEIVTPPLRHPHPLIPMLASVVNPTDGVVVLVGESPLNRVVAPQAGLVEQRRSGRAQAM